MIDTLRNRDLRRGAEGLGRDDQRLAGRGRQLEAGSRATAKRSVLQLAVSAIQELDGRLVGVRTDHQAGARQNHDLAVAAVCDAAVGVFPLSHFAGAVTAAGAAVGFAAAAGLTVVAAEIAAAGRCRAAVRIELAGVAGESPADEALSDARAGLAVQVSTVTALARVDCSVAAAGTAVPGA